jgi:hypothetical protein
MSRLQIKQVIAVSNEGCTEYSFLDQFGRIWERVSVRDEKNEWFGQRWEVKLQLPATTEIAQEVTNEF